MHSIRPARPDDAACIAEVHVASWRAGYAGLLPDELLASLSVEERTTSWTGNLAASAVGRTFAALSDDGAIRGFASVGPSRDEDASPETGELWALYTHPDHWRLGVGAALIETAVQDLVERGFQRATLWVLTENERARRFYEHHGWRADGVTKVDARGDVRLDEVRYERALTS